MDFETWEPVYERILEDMGYDRGADERARDVYAGTLRALGGNVFDGSLDFAGDRVAIAGAGPSLADELDVARRADAVVAASSAGRRLLASEVGVDCLVTDLDGAPETAVRLTTYETPVAIHAHGDNAIAIQEYVPRCRLSSVLPTTQAAPRSPVRNFGGFTDGDRAAFLADHFGASELVFPGWDLDDPTVGPTKRRKLRWAERLLHWLERRRDERFDLLEGRRDGIDPIGP
ncbi:6-hydroxymethylpterin diphosphokinase MptE-like protein [Halapricum desulfuricans]|uniref:6-hydroxymethyl-7,8-dihydropterin pyrophosphokinase n=1 Tax=Halapricum desulfuricans TaxID=2841257 RepID=A0A897N122_9EURY|nr:6-hydroxymethylpterin diphosphokinase MptE-like protein [Halapricum desulfuricans]QSG06201.1 putative Rossmann fold enzyme [Halapricum desulfuricans]